MNRAGSSAGFRVRVDGLVGRACLGLSVAAFLVQPGVAQQRNERGAKILAMFDIDGDGTADGSADTDGDGLPDTWEVGGSDPQNTDVPFPGPLAIVIGSPPTPSFSRRLVRTSATAPDTDGDGLSDFIEVFGLAFIDDNGNGVLDDACARDADGNVIFNADGTAQRLDCDCLNAAACFRRDWNGALITGVSALLAGECDAGVGEWFDLNGDGMPSIGEYPARNVLIADSEFDADYDGFIFTDPTSADTDGDGINDAIDVDPLVNPSAFGLVTRSDEDDVDLDFDNDGLGDFMDLGNDFTGLLDNPQDLRRAIEVLRGDLFELFGRQNVRVPEALIEDLLQADWNGDGLFRITDVRNPHFGMSAAQDPTDTCGADCGLVEAVTGVNLFTVADPDSRDGGTIELGFARTEFPAGFSRLVYYNFDNRGEDGVDAPLPFQTILVPSRRDENPFLPDPRIWTVLYAWRMPGFDIDGDGFIGFDSASFQGQTIDVNGTALAVGADSAPTTEILVAPDVVTARDLDGQIDFTFDSCGPGACGATGATTLALTLLGLLLMRGRR